MYSEFSKILYEVNQVLKQFSTMTYDAQYGVFYTNTSGRDFFLECKAFHEVATKIKMPSFSVDCKELFAFLRDGKKTITKILPNGFVNGETIVKLEPIARHVKETIDKSYANIVEIQLRSFDFKKNGETDLLFDLAQGKTKIFLDEDSSPLQVKSVNDLLVLLKENKNLTNNDLVYINFYSEGLVLRSSKTFLESDVPMFITDRHCFRKYKHLVKNNHIFRFVFKNDRYETLMLEYGNEVYRISILMHGNFILDE